jgi:hypothetical protein
VDRMPLMWREATLHMEWCLECHRQPERFVGPRELVFATGSAGERNTVAASRTRKNWALEYHVQSKTDCTVCHR